MSNFLDLKIGRWGNDEGDVEFSVRTFNALVNPQGSNSTPILTVRELIEQTECQLLRRKNFGRKSLNEVKEILFQNGLGLKPKLLSNDQKQNLAVERAINICLPRISKMLKEEMSRQLFKNNT